MFGRKMSVKLQRSRQGTTYWVQTDTPDIEKKEYYLYGSVLA